MLRQVLHNLFQNAIDALTGVEGPRILVTTSLATGGVLLTVARQWDRHCRGRHGPHLRAVRDTKPKGTGSASRS